MGILNIDDVPPPFGAGGEDGSRPADVGSSPSGQAAASAGARTGGGAPGAAPPAGGGFAVPPHVDGSAPPPQAPPTPPVPGQPPASSFGAGAASAPTGADGAWGAADAAPAAESSAFDTSALTGAGPEGPAASPGAAASPPPPIEPDPVRTLELEPRIVEQLATVFDPEIPVNIYELGLIYDVAVDKQSLAVIRMTLTAPGCPAAVTLPAEVQGKVKAIDGVADARVDVVWEPPWDKDRMSDAAKLQLGIFD